MREESGGAAGYCISEYVDGKEHGHFVWYVSAGNVLGEDDYLRGMRQPAAVEYPLPVPPTLAARVL